MSRAPFIWTAKQKIDPDGFFAAIRGVPPRSDGLNRWFLFRRRVDVPFEVSQSAINITCDGKYQLFLNGQRLGRGPVRCSPLRQRFDTYVDAPFVKGANVIGVLVHTYGIDTAFYESVHGHWRSTFGDGALWLDGIVSGAGQSIQVQTDAEWRALTCDAWENNTPQMTSALGFVEQFDANLFPEDWTGLDYSDAHWDETHVLATGFGGPESRFGGAQTKPFPVMAPSMMPQMLEQACAPRRLVWTRKIEPSDLPVERQAYEEELSSPSLASSGAVNDVSIPPTDGAALLFDFGEILAGRPRITFEASGGEVIDIVVSERLPGEFDPGGPALDARIERLPIMGLDAHVCRVIARPGKQVFEAFEWDAVRWMQIHVRNAKKGLRFQDVSVVSTRYPGKGRGAFECSDPLLNKLWELGRKTLELCMHDGWIDCPGREQRQWLGDSTVEHLVGEAVFGPEIHALNRHFLRSAAESQRTDGLLEMFAPGDHRRFGWIIPDYSLHWIFNLWDHFEHSNDVELVRSLFPSLLKVLAWFEELAGEDGRVADLPYWHFQDWAALGRTGYSTVLNAELCGAFDIAARLAGVLGWDSEAARRSEQARRLKQVLETHWDAARGLYADCVDPTTDMRQPRTSQHANAAMILWGGVEPDRAASIAARIGDRTLLRLTPAPPIILEGEGFEEAKHIVLANTFFSHFVYTALAKAGRFDLALDLMRERYGSMIKRGATTLWEGFEPHASLAHGFSATPTWQMMRQVLGIKPAAAGFAHVRIEPTLGVLGFARGSQPTLAGDIEVALRRTGDVIEVEVALPDGVIGELVAPSGYVVEGMSRLEAGRQSRALRRRRQDGKHNAAE